MTEWTFCPVKPGTYTWGVQTIDAAYTGSVFTKGPEFTVTEEDIANCTFTIKNEQLKNKNETYDLSGRKLSNCKLSNCQIQRGVYIQDGKKVLIK